MHMQTIAGRILSALAILFLLFDSGGKLLKAQPFIDGTIQLGYQATIVFPLGVILLVCVVAYLIPASISGASSGAASCCATAACVRSFLGR